MAHLGVLCFQGAGHLNPLVALSRELVSRGHQVSFFLPSEFESLIRRQGLGFVPINLPEVEPNGSRMGASQPKSDWTESTRARLDRIDKEIGVYLREYLTPVEAAGVDALLMGEITLAGPTVAEILRIPYFVISTSIPQNFGWDAPQSWLTHRTMHERLHARIFEVTISSIRGPVRYILDRYRREVGLGSVVDMKTTFPELAHITQWPRCLDTPRSEVPDRFFYTGPFVDMNAHSSIEFPWQKLNGRPLIYASLGTTRKAGPEIYHRLASACAGLDLQLVITLGGRRNLESFANLPGDPLVVENAPQVELLKRAELVITHAGPNTALESLLLGKPMLALPIALDQPAIAAHLERLGVAEVVYSPHRSADEIRERLLRLIGEARYRKAAATIQAKLQSLHGAAEAASIVGEALNNKKQSSPLLHSY